MNILKNSKFNRERKETYKALYQGITKDWRLF